MCSRFFCGNPWPACRATNTSVRETRLKERNPIFMFKKTLIMLCLLVLLVPAAVHAQQNPPQAVLDAVAALSQKLGVSLALKDMAGWTWEQLNFPDSSLGCPLPGQTYPPKVTNGFIVRLTYNSVTYDYRVSGDRQIIFLCSPGGGAPGGSASGTTPIPTPTQSIPAAAPTVVIPPSGTAVCSGGMVTRLAVGMQGQCITTGSINIRSQPNTTSQVAGLMLPQGLFTVTGGPQCAGNQTWWQVSYKTQTGVVTTGWVMEGDPAANDYWLQPYGVVPATSATRITAANAAQIQLLSQTPLPAQVYAVAVPSEVTPSPFIINGSYRQVDFLSGVSLASLLTMGTGDADTITAVALGSGSYRVAFTEVVPSNPAVSNLLALTLLPGADKPVFSGQFGLQMPWVNSLAFSADGSRLAAGTGRLPNGDPAITNGVWVWDAATGAQITGLPFGAPVAAVAFSPDGNTLAVATIDNVVHLWSLATNSEAATLSSTVGTVPGVTLAFSPDGTLLAVVASDAVRVWDVASRTLRFTLVPNANQFPRQVAFSPDGSLLAVSGNAHSDILSYISIWDLSTGAQLTNQPIAELFLPAIRFNLDGTQLIVVGAQWYVWGVR